MTEKEKEIKVWQFQTRATSYDKKKRIFSALKIRFFMPAIGGDLEKTIFNFE